MTIYYVIKSEILLHRVSQKEHLLEFFDHFHLSFQTQLGIFGDSIFELDLILKFVDHRRTVIVYLI